MFWFKVLHGGDLSLRDNDGYTPFHLAAREGHLEAFTDMLRKGIIDHWRFFLAFACLKTKR